MRPNPLRNIPSVNELLENATVKSLLERIHPSAVLSTARAVLDEVAAEVHTAAVERTLPSMTELADRIVRRVMATEAPGLRPVINATGVVFHDELGPPPLADRVIESAAAVLRECMVSNAGASPADTAIDALLAELTGAEAAMVVGNEPAAVVLALAAVAEGRSVVVSRGHLLRRSGEHAPIRTGTVAGLTFQEVGAVDATSREDYENAVGDDVGALLWADLGGLPRAETTRQVPERELVRLGREKNLPVVCDLGPAALFDLAPYGLGALPTVSRSVAAGADLVAFGHELIGAPPCGILVGRRAMIDQARRHPLAALVAANRSRLAAVTAALEIARDPERARRTLPVLQLATSSVENLENRAARLAEQMAASPAVATAEPAANTTTLGSAGHLAVSLPTFCIALTPAGMSVNALAEALLGGEPAVRVRRDGGELLLDLRSVLPRQDISLVDAVLGLPG